MDPASLLLKAFVDQVLKRLPDPNDKARLRVQDALLRQLVDRNQELENIAEILARVGVQRDDLLTEVIRLRLRIAELEAEKLGPRED